MLKTVCRVAAVCVSLLALLALAGCGGSDDAVVARVGRVSITQATLNHWTALMASGPVQELASPERRTLQRHALGFLISADWMIGEAADRGVKATEHEVQRLFVHKREESAPTGEGEFREFLEQTGQTSSDMRFKLEVELAATRVHRLLTEQEPAISQGQVARYYAKNKNLYVTPERRAIEIVEVRGGATARRVRREIEAGTQIASLHPIGESFALTNRAGEPERQKIQKAIFTAKPHALTGPIKLVVRSIYGLFEVTAVTPAIQQPLAQVQEQIKAKLAEQQRQATIGDFIAAWTRRWLPMTDCSSGFVVPQCKQYKGAARAPVEDPFSLV